MPRLFSLSIASLMSLAMLQAGCATTSVAEINAATAQAAAMAAAAPSGSYRLGLGDKLRIVVFGEKDLSGEFQVSGGGVVNVPLVGDVPAVGLTAMELQDQLVARYQAGYIKDPKISVEIYEFRPFFILGEIERPGRFAATEGLNVLSAIATAGGFTYRADTKRIFIRRAGETVERAVAVSANIAIQPGDVIRVGERRF